MADNNFYVYTLQDQAKLEGPMYTHWAKGLSMHISKDGVSIKLNEEEIKKLVKSLPRTIGGRY